MLINLLEGIAVLSFWCEQKGNDAVLIQSCSLVLSDMFCHHLKPVLRDPKEYQAKNKGEHGEPLSFDWVIQLHGESLLQSFLLPSVGIYMDILCWPAKQK